MKLIIELKDETYKFFKENVPILVARGNGKFLLSEMYEAIASGTPYNPSGDLISREALKKAIFEHCRSETECLNHFWYDENIIAIIDNAQAVPQVTVFTESTDEKAIEDMKAELQNVIGARPKGEWKKLYGQNFYCSNCKKDREQNHINFCGYCGADMT